MKKSSGVLGVVVVLALAYTAGSWYVGQQAQKAIEESVDQANQRVIKILGPDFNGSGLNIAISEYKRHVFSSDVVYSLRLKDVDGEPLEYLLSDHLQHGPFPVGALKDGQFAPLLAYSKARMIPSGATQKWFDSLNGESPVEVVTKVGFSGQGQSTWQFKPLDVAAEGEAFKFSGGAVEVTFSNNFENSATRGRFESFSLVSAADDEKVQFNGIAFSNDTVTSGEKHVKVQSSATIDSLDVSAGGGPGIQVEKMTIGLDSQQNDNLLDGSLRYDFGRIKVDDVDLGSVSVAANATRLDAAALGALTAEYDAIKARHGVKDDGILDLTEAESEVLRGKLLDVLASNPSLAIEPATWKNDKGESVVSIRLDLNGPADKGAAAQSTLDAFLPGILKLVSLDISVSRPMFVKAFGQLQEEVPAGQAEDLGAMIFDQYAGKLAQAGLAQVEGDKAASSIRYENGEIEANGKKMPVSEFMQRALVLIM